MRLTATLAGALGVMAASACGAEPPSGPQIPADMKLVEATSDPRQWEAHGYIELTTPIRPPTTSDETARIIVYLRVPEGAELSGSQVPDGTSAVRVEYAAPARTPDAPVSNDWRVLDVRSFAWSTGRRECSVLRPARAGHLAGLAWPCSDANDVRAAEVLAALVQAGRFGPRSEGARDRMAHHLGRINGCTRCHAPSRGEDRRPGVLVQRGTDAAGLFTLRSVFQDEDAAERYRPVDSNHDDPLVTRQCPESTLASDGEHCADGRWPRLRLDLAAGLRADTSHARRVCAARHALSARIARPHSDDLTRALTTCKLEPP